MTTFLEIRAAIININDALDGLVKFYDPVAAAELEAKLHCTMPCFAEALTEPSTLGQQVAHGDIYRCCLELEIAIRQAQFYPHRTELQDAAVLLVCELETLFIRHREMFGL